MPYKFNPFTGKLDNAPGAPVFNDAKFTIFDDGNKTKRFQFEASAISPSTTRTLDIQDVDGPVAIGYGLANQYIRGDATISNFPVAAGGGSSVSYYFNGSVSQGTILGNPYYEINKVPAGAAQTNFTINAGSTTAYFITDANDPALLLIPQGNFTFQLYCSTSSGNPKLAVELYKYDGATFTQIGATSPAVTISNTTSDIHLLTVAVPASTTLALTDRLAVRVIGSSLGGHTITLNTEGNTQSQIITTFSTGLAALNGLTDQIQFFATGTSGTDFNISSSAATHNFNLPTASAANRGALSSADWTAFNGKVTSVTATAPITSSGGATPVISTSMATSRLLGRTTAGTGVAEEISTAGTLTLTGGTLTGTGVGGSVGAVDNAVLRADVGTGVVQNSSIIIDDETTSTQNNVAIRNNDSQTNSALVLSPKGTGALLAQKPDGTATGGNARGNYAVDLQLQRSAATQVAGGLNAVILAGQNNTASGSYSVAGGTTCIASNFACVAIGQQMSATGAAAVSVGGFSGQAQGSYSTVIGGQSNISSGSNSGIFSSDNSTASGSTGVVLGGSGSRASNTNSAAFGASALSDRRAMQAYSAGQFAAQGDAQRARFVLRNKTTTNAAVELFLDGSSTRLTIPSGKIFAFTINISGVKSDGTAVAHYLRQYALKNVAGTTTEVYAPVTIGTDNAAGTTIALSANDTNDALKVEVTGITSEIWRWVASVDAVEIAYGT